MDKTFKFEFSTFTRKGNSTATHFTRCIDDFMKLLSEHHVRSKKDGKLFAPALFKGSRSNENFISASGICLDFDHGQPTVEQVLKLFPLTLAAYYSTHSHTPENPRFRVVIPLSRPVNADEHSRLALGVRSIIPPELMECIDASCLERARSHYLPSCPPEYERHAFTGHQTGDPLDVEHFMSLALSPTVLKDLNPVSITPKPYDFTDHDSGEVFNLRVWAAQNPTFDFVAAVNSQVLRGKPKDGKQHIVCPFEDQHTDKGKDLATYISNASPPLYTAWNIHCMHSHCVDRDRLEFLRAMLEKGWLSIDVLEKDTPTALEKRRPPRIYFPVNDSLLAEEWTTLKPDERRIALDLTILAWSDDGTINNDDWMIARRLGLPEKEWLEYRKTLKRAGWLVESDGRLSNDMIKKEFIKAQAAYMTAITKARNGGLRTQEKRKNEASA